MSDARSCYRNDKTSAIPYDDLYVTNLSLSGLTSGGNNVDIGIATFGDKRADSCCFVSKWYYLKRGLRFSLEGRYDLSCAGRPHETDVFAVVRVRLDSHPVPHREAIFPAGFDCEDRLIQPE